MKSGFVFLFVLQALVAGSAALLSRAIGWPAASGLCCGFCFCIGVAAGRRARR
jgi:hypothetical protein